MLGLWSYIGEVRSTAEGDSGWILFPESIRSIDSGHVLLYEFVRRPPLRPLLSIRWSWRSLCLVFTHNPQRCRSYCSGLFFGPPSTPFFRTGQARPTDFRSHYPGRLDCRVSRASGNVYCPCSGSASRQRHLVLLDLAARRHRPRRHRISIMNFCWQLFRVGRDLADS